MLSARGVEFIVYCLGFRLYFRVEGPTEEGMSMTEESMYMLPL